MELIYIMLAQNALWMLFVWQMWRMKPRNNTKAGQQILAETEDINALAGSQKYHLEQAEAFQVLANQHMRQAAEKADIMQVRANHAKDAIAN